MLEFKGFFILATYLGKRYNGSINKTCTQKGEEA